MDEGEGGGVGEDVVEGPGEGGGGGVTLKGVRMKLKQRERCSLQQKKIYLSSQ